MTTARVTLSKFRWTQIHIAFCGTLMAIFMWTGHIELSAILGLSTQPAWFLTAWRHKQWGVLWMSVVFTLFYAGILYQAVYGDLNIKQLQ